MFSIFKLPLTSGLFSIKLNNEIKRGGNYCAFIWYWKNYWVIKHGSKKIVKIVARVVLNGHIQFPSSLTKLILRDKSKKIMEIANVFTTSQTIFSLLDLNCIFYHKTNFSFFLSTKNAFSTIKENIFVMKLYRFSWSRQP